MKKLPTLLLLALKSFSVSGFLSAETVAYWRFEGGPATTIVAEQIDAIPDSSGNEHHMRTWSHDTAPKYIAEVPFESVPQTGEPNQFSLKFDGHQDIYADDGYEINGLSFKEWTLEVSFKPDVVNNYQVIVGKDGNLAEGMQPAFMKLLPNGHLEVGLIDGSGALRLIQSPEPLETGQWYSAAATATDTVLSLWLKRPGDAAYVLQGTTEIDGAFIADPDINETWTIGRGMWHGNNVDFFRGLIDEVRLSDHVFSPFDFLGIEPGGLTGKGTLIELSEAAGPDHSNRPEA